MALREGMVEGVVKQNAKSGDRRNRLGLGEVYTRSAAKYGVAAAAKTRDCTYFT